MNQPKFLFGEKVVQKNKRTNRQFVVAIIRLRDGIFQYGCDHEAAYLWFEEDLELYQEPQKKKLYAYKYEEAIVFSVTDAKWLSIGRAYEAHRAPEYDIEYPGVKV